MPLDERHHLPLSGNRIPESPQRLRGEPGPDHRMRDTGTVGVGLSEIVEKPCKTDAQRRVALGEVLHDGELVLVERLRLPGRIEPIADRIVHLRQDHLERARVTHQPQGVARARAEEEPRELAHPVRGDPAADPLRRDVHQAGARGVASAPASRAPG